MQQPVAFVLAAGLGTRLRPLTATLPKPLMPIFHKPLISFALDSLIAAGVGTIALNTHHLPESFRQVFGSDPHYREKGLRIFHEPLLLDTGGGMRNARSAFGESSFFLYNGDILADLPLAELLAAHRASGALATLLLRDGGGVANVRFDEATGRVLDLRGSLGVQDGESMVYSGIAVFEPGIFDWIPNEGPYSIIDALLEAMRAGEQVGGLPCRSQEWPLWIDIGTPAAYFEAHRLLSLPGDRPSYMIDEHWPLAIHPEAVIHSSSRLEGIVVAGPGVTVGEDAILRDSILWPGTTIGRAAQLEECIVRGTLPVEGKHHGVIL